MHNREAPIDLSKSNFAFGYLMRGSNMATIMAYRRGQYNNRIGYFSNDDYELKGVRMGTRRDDNRRQLMEARFAVARYGTNRGSCSGGEGGGGTSRSMYYNHFIIIIDKPL